MLYPHILLHKASPKAISRRTSYLRVRLEFLRYPQFIPKLFNAYEFGPPLDFTLASSWPWIGHPVSGLLYMTYSPFSDSISLRLHSFLEFNLATYNNSLDRSTKSTISRLKSLYLLVNIGFQVLFHSPPGVLFTFPSRYYSTIDHQVVFSLMGWSPLFHTRFHVPRITLDPTMLLPLSYTGLSPSMVCFSKTFLLDSWVIFVVRHPRWITSPGLGSSCFARHYFRNRVFFLFLQVLRCFSSLRSPLIRYFTYVWITRLFSLVEFPHSDIYGSMNICFSP